MFNLSNIFRYTKKVIYSLENMNVPFFYFFLTFFFIVTLRNFIELFSDHYSVISFIQYLHYDLSYLVLALVLILFFNFVTKTDIIKVSKVVLPSFLVVLLAPIFDLIISKGKGFDIAYMMPNTYPDIIVRFFTFFGEFAGLGISPGIKLEVALVLFASFIYFRVKNINLFKSLIYTICTYFIIFTYLASPFIIFGLFNWTGLSFNYNDLFMSNFFLFILLILLLLILYLRNKDFFVKIIKDIRPYRLMHYELLFILGISLALNQGYTIADANSVFYFVFIVISIALAWIFSVMTNNIVDYKIDKVTNKDRPLVNSTVDFKLYKKSMWFILLFSLLFSLKVDYKAFFIISLFIGNYFIYSMPPIRFKRVTFFSKLTIAVNSLLLVILGFIFMGAPFNLLPNSLYFIILVGFTAVTNFIDIKDYEGDKLGGIKTLPVLMGLKNSKRLIGLFFILAYLSVFFIIDQISISLFCLFLGLVQYFFINKKDYNEKPVLRLHVLSLLGIIIYILFIGVNIIS